MSQQDAFSFLNPGRLVDRNLELVLVQKCPADLSRGFVPAYGFEMRRVGDDRKMGDISLRVGNNENIRKYAGHIGFNVEPKFRGNRYAVRSCILILPLAKSHSINPVFLTCNPENIASRRTCEIVGAKFVEIVTVPKDHLLYKKGDHFKCRYRLDL